MKRLTDPNKVRNWRMDAIRDSVFHILTDTHENATREEVMPLLERIDNEDLLHEALGYIKTMPYEEFIAVITALADKHEKLMERIKENLSEDFLNKMSVKKDFPIVIRKIAEYDEADLSEAYIKISEANRLHRKLNNPIHNIVATPLQLAELVVRDKRLIIEYVQDAIKLLGLVDEDNKYSEFQSYDELYSIEEYDTLFKLTASLERKQDIEFP